ncbi:unnamed protein product [Rhizoctonia solani]|uniref:Uncharacterized protein n=1 Tax=Rhizoctonia solani TaxID=456999 RepID=A0A8H3CWJ1_9AGAM|nr:unnamed protein product [Rhizoctonia solani]
MIRGDHYFGLYDELDIEDPDDLNYTSLLIIALGRRQYEEPVYLNFETRFGSFDVDLTQELVVLIEARSGDPTLARFHFRSAIDGKPHPLARHASISIQLEDPGIDELIHNPVLEIQTEILGKTLIIGFYWSDLALRVYELLIFDWASGVLLGKIRSETTLSGSFALLDNHHLALLSVTCRISSRHLEMVNLMIYQLPCIALQAQDKSGLFDTFLYPSLAPILVLDFPPISDSVLLWGDASAIQLRTNPGVGQVVFDGPSTLVCSRVPILEVRMSLHNHEHKTLIHFTYQVYISTFHIFDLLARRDPVRERFSWNEWGPRATRWFSDTGSRSLVGTQCVQWVKNGKHNKLSTIEFNPRPLEGFPVPVEMFGSDVKSVFYDCFKEPVESFLPYRIASPENVSKMDKHQRWDIQGHRLIGYPPPTHALAPAVLICDTPPT